MFAIQRHRRLVSTRILVLFAIARHLFVAGQLSDFDSNTISLTIRTGWCSSQIQTCSILCGGNPDSNSCDPSRLSYACVCQNGQSPPMEQYTETLPTYVCLEQQKDCINSSGTGNTAEQAECLNRFSCPTATPSSLASTGAQSSSPESTEPPDPTSSSGPSSNPSSSAAITEASSALAGDSTVGPGTSASGSMSTGTHTPDSSLSDDKRLSSGAIGSIIGGIVAVLLVVVLVVWLIIRRRRKKWAVNPIEGNSVFKADAAKLPFAPSELPSHQVTQSCPAPWPASSQPAAELDEYQSYRAELAGHTFANPQFTELECSRGYENQSVLPQPPWPYSSRSPGSNLAQNFESVTGPSQPRYETTGVVYREAEAIEKTK